MDFITQQNPGLGMGLKARPGRLEWFQVPIFGSMVAIFQRILHGAVLHEPGGRTSAEFEAAQALLCSTVDELTRSNKELEELAVVRHDMQKPLALLKANVNLLRDRYQGKLDLEADQQLTIAVEGVAWMERLVDDLQAYSRLGFQPRAFLPVNLESSLNSALLALGSDLDAARAELTRDPMPMIAADGLQLAQVFQNLIGNAIKFRASRPLKIHIGMRRVDQHRIFYVKDNGMGMDPLQSHRIFDLFQQLDPALGRPGTGMGLSICKKIVERHGGRIWVDSSPAKGSTFSFTLPDGTGCKPSSEGSSPTLLRRRP